jgi:hypothetical protein
MRHLLRILRVVAAIAVATLPAAIADPHLAHLIASNPFLATYEPIAAGVLYAIYKAWRDTKTDAGEVASSSGSPTMGAL